MMLTKPSWWVKVRKYIVLAAAALTQLFGLGYANGSAMLMPVLFEQRFGDRKVAGAISSLQIALSFIAALPCVYVGRRIGDRMLQIIGGIMLSGGIAVTAFVPQAWQALIATSFIGGIGVAATVSASFSITAKHFPGHQMAPFALLTFSYNSGAILFPQIIGATIEPLGFTGVLLLMAGLAAVTAVCGLLYTPETGESEEESENSKPVSLLSLRPKAKTRGIYYVTLDHRELTGKKAELPRADEKAEACTADEKAEVCTADEKAEALANIRTTKPRPSQTVALSLLLAKAYESFTNDFSPPPTYQEAAADRICTAATDAKSPKTLKGYLNDAYGPNVAGLLTDAKTGQSSLRDLLRKPVVVVYVVHMGFVAFSNVGFSAILRDYATYKLNISNEDFLKSLMIYGIATIPSGLAYMALTRFTSFGFNTFHICWCLVISSLYLSLLYPVSTLQFYLIMTGIGVARPMFLNNLYANAVEITSPDQAVVMYSLEMLVDGICGCVAPYLAAYLQVEVDIRAGLILLGVAQIAALLLMLPFALKYLFVPRDITESAAEGQEVKYLSHKPGLDAGDYIS